MFADPTEMASAYFEQLRNTQERDSYIEDQMKEYKGNAVKKIYKYVDPFIAEAIASTIACAYENELPQAIDIVKKLRLNDKHLAALNDDSERMCQLILEEVRQTEHYENYGE
jgi:hypothetical protein